MTGYPHLEQLLTNSGVKWERDVSLKEHCTFKIGGLAEYMAFPADEGQVAATLAAAREASVPLMILGKGSNMLFSDRGYSGLVLVLGSLFSSMRLLDDVTIECESGAPLSQLCLFAGKHGLSGLEFAYGIPGSVGGAVYMNAGAYGGEMKDVLIRAHHITRSGEFGVLEGEELQLSYRHSAYTETDSVILKAMVRLKQGDQSQIRAGMDRYMHSRREKQPLDFPSAGSVFKRPEGAYASALIDQCGLKGHSVGGAMVSKKHAGFIVNTGGATCEDVLRLVEDVQKTVHRETGYHLECEIKTAT